MAKFDKAKKGNGEDDLDKCFFTSLMAVLITGDYFNEQMADSWKDFIKLILIAGTVMIFYVIGSFYSTFYQFRQTEREVRKLIYQDMLFQLKNKKN